MDEGETANIGGELPGRHIHLPFEFNDADKLGPWDILLSESTIKDIQNMLLNENVEDMRVELPFTIERVMEKLRQLSSGAWNKYKLKLKVSSLIIPIYEVEVSDNGLKIIWQVDYGFSTRSHLYTQHVKVWAVTACQENINNTLKILKSVHKIYTSEYISRCTITGKGNVDLPKCFGDQEIVKFTDEKLSDEKLLEAHKILVTNKFIPISRNLFKSLILSGSDFAFQVSKTEYEIISHPTTLAIVFGRSGTGKTTCIVFRQLVSYLRNKLYRNPLSHSGDEDFSKRQIFITVNKELCKRVKKYFKKLQNSLLAGKNISKVEFIEWKKKTRDVIMEELDVKIPNLFRQLEDHHFPLFVTFHKFSKMLQGTYGIDTRMLTTKPNQKHDKLWKRFVDYNLFEKKYWRHLSDSYRKNLDCELVYSEFSIIKGMNIEVDYLSREEYRSISTRKYPAFCYNRDEIYDLFEKYEMKKAQNYDFDSMDRTLAILRAMKTRTFDGPHIHEVYIDECQDNQIIDYELIFKLFNRADSIYLAGDVAQCIARGSSFRFQDLYALMYQQNLNRVQNNQYNFLKPVKFELNVNYRSHNGILRLASSVIHLIQHFFPDSIDQLSPEYGKIDGPQPLIFEDCQAETFFNTGIIDKDNKEEDTPIEFGASQVVIVRDKATVDRVKEINKAIRPVFTVFEAKGLEFNDVILYNFFTDSPARSKWRVILSVLNDYDGGIRTFSHEKHYILSSELKHLYVAITRARERLLIFDEDAELSEPIRTYWKCRNLVKVAKENNISSLLKKSSSLDWNDEGQMFYEQQRYELAMFYFQKSGNKEREKLAYAYHLQKDARDSFIIGSDRKIVESKFASAALAFKKCNLLKKAASCYEDVDMYEKAGDCYVELNMIETAAHCYLKGEMWNKAGKHFEDIKKYDDAVKAYKNGRSYEKVTDLIQG